MKIISKKEKLKGFTLLEILIVVALIVILATIVIYAINPAKQFANTRNSQRRSDIKALADAVYQYSIDNKNFPPPIDDAMRTVGNATTGCDIICGKKIAKLQNSKNETNYFVQNFKTYFNNPIALASSSLLENNEINLDNPQIISAQVSPVKVWPGDEMTITVEIRDIYGIKSVVADMGGIENVELKLKNGNEFDGIWEAKWKAHNTEEKQYTTIITAVNDEGFFFKKELSWSDPPLTGWVFPTSSLDPNNQWSNENNAYDGNSGTYSQNSYGGTGWGEFVTFNLDSPILSDRVRVNADYNDAQIQEVDVDVFVDGAWVDVFQGGNQATWDCKWVELTFTKGMASQARFRYNYRTGGYSYWLYEFQFYQAAENINLPVCSSREAIAIQEDVAILQGLISDDGGEPCETQFEYGTNTSYGNSTGWNVGAKTGDVFATTITGLTNNTNYHFRGQIKNSAGTVNCPDSQFTTAPAPIGWILPTGDDDPSGTWENETLGYDNNTATYARSYHTINVPQWSEYFYLTHSSIKADKVKFYARGGSEVSSVDVDVYKDGAWENVYEGSFSDKNWEEKNFSEGTVTQVRIRFYAAFANHGFYWELYELSLNKTSLNNSIECVNLEPFLVPKYLAAMPKDPSTGSLENSHYAIRKNDNNRITIYSCDAELEEEILISR